MPWKSSTGVGRASDVWTCVSELKENMIKRTGPSSRGAQGVWMAWQLCLEEKPVKATGSPCRPKERKLFPGREWHFGKLKIASVISHVRILVSKKKCNKLRGLKASSISYRSHNHL